MEELTTEQMAKAKAAYLDDMIKASKVGYKVGEYVEDEFIKTGVLNPRAAILTLIQSAIVLNKMYIKDSTNKLAVEVTIDMVEIVGSVMVLNKEEQK